MNDVARPAAQDGVKAVITGDCVADLSAFTQTVKIRGAEIPAEGPLANVAGDSAGVADLWRSRFSGGVR